MSSGPKFLNGRFYVTGLNHGLITSIGTMPKDSLRRLASEISLMRHVMNAPGAPERSGIRAHVEVLRYGGREGP